MCKVPGCGNDKYAKDLRQRHYKWYIRHSKDMDLTFRKLANEPVLIRACEETTERHINIKPTGRKIKALPALAFLTRTPAEDTIECMLPHCNDTIYKRGFCRIHFNLFELCDHDPETFAKVEKKRIQNRSNMRRSRT